MVRKIAANYVYPVDGQPIKNGVVVVDETGMIVEVQNPGDKIEERANVEFYNGVLVPGFVNTHCHLELSHLRAKFESKTGMQGFIKQIFTRTGLGEPPEIAAAIKRADAEMQANGIVAVGDIANTSDSFDIKQRSPIYYHTFVEVFTSDESKNEAKFAVARQLLTMLDAVRLSASVVPHAPYSVSPALFRLIRQLAEERQSIVSFHNQESEAENELFRTKGGAIVDLFASFGIGLNYIQPEGKTSLAALLQQFAPSLPTLLIHNTFTTQADINLAQSYFRKLYWTVCPQSNLFIENTLPPLDLFVANNIKLTIGTDSYASNTSLSVLDEMKVIQKHFPDISFAQMLEWASRNGAEALGIEHNVGSFAVGKRPGLNLISNFDFRSHRLTDGCSIKKLM